MLERHFVDVWIDGTTLASLPTVEMVRADLLQVSSGAGPTTVGGALVLVSDAFASNGAIDIVANVVPAG